MLLFTYVLLLRAFRSLLLPAKAIVLNLLSVAAAFVGSFVDLQQFGFGLAIAILVDVTIIRVLLLPSAMALFGRWNWWLPDSVARVTRVEPSTLQPPPGRVG